MNTDQPNAGQPNTDWPNTGQEAGSRRRSGSVSDKEPLQVRIPTGVKRQFKAAAAMRGLEPHELFVEVWEHYQRTRPE